MTALLTEYLGAGLMADRPVAPDIVAGALAFYFATDVSESFIWNPDIPDWQSFVIGEAPMDTTSYARKDGLWEVITFPIPDDAPSDGDTYGRKDGAWEATVPGITDAPSDGTEYVRKDAAWTHPAVTAIGDAPSDGTEYVRKNAAWVHAVPAANPTDSIIVVVGDETTNITTGVSKVTLRMPYAFTLTAVRSSLSTASSSGLPTVDINEGGVSILSTKLTIDATEKTSTTAATPAVISDSSLADDAEITIDIDVAGTGAKGLKVYLIGHRT